MEKSEGRNISSSELWKKGRSFGMQPAPYICRWMNRHSPVPAAVLVCLMRDCLLRALFRYVTQMMQNKFHSYLMRIKLYIYYVWMEVPFCALPQVSWRWLGILQSKKICFYLCVVVLAHSMEQSPSWEANRGFQLVKKFSIFYGTRRFITAFTSARHLSISWASSIQSIPLHSTSCRSTLCVVIIEKYKLCRLKRAFCKWNVRVKTEYRIPRITALSTMVTISTRYTCRIIKDPSIFVHTVYMLHVVLSTHSAIISQLQ